MCMSSTRGNTARHNTHDTTGSDARRVQLRQMPHTIVGPAFTCDPHNLLPIECTMNRHLIGIIYCTHFLPDAIENFPPVT